MKCVADFVMSRPASSTCVSTLGESDWTNLASQLGRETATAFDVRLGQVGVVLAKSKLGSVHVPLPMRIGNLANSKVDPAETWRSSMVTSNACMTGRLNALDESPTQFATVFRVALEIGVKALPFDENCATWTLIRVGCPDAKRRRQASRRLGPALRECAESRPSELCFLRSRLKPGSETVPFNRKVPSLLLGCCAFLS